MICIVCPGGIRGKGGIGRMVETFTTDLRRHRPDLRLEVIDTYGPGPFLLMPPFFLAALCRLTRRFASGDAVLAHVHVAVQGSVLRKGLVMALAALFGVPVVLHLHSGRFPEHYQQSGTTLRWVIARMVGTADEVIVLGENARRFLRSAFPASVRRITVLPNAVPGPDEPPARSNGVARLLFLGRLVPLKGVDVLLDALAGDACRQRGWTLTIAGDGDLDACRRRATALGLDGRVRFTGWLDADDCRRELAAADALVLPSLSEGLPMAVLEAMAYGLAVVATRVGSVPEAIESEISGLLVPAGDAGALADALVRVIDDPGLRVRLGAAARVRYEQRFGLPTFRARILDVYRRNARHWHAEPPAPAPAEGARPPPWGEQP